MLNLDVNMKMCIFGCMVWMPKIDFALVKNDF